MRCWAVRIFTVVSLVLCIGVLVLWVKGRVGLGDAAGREWVDAKRDTLHRVEVDSLQGCVGFGGYSYVYDRSKVVEGKRMPAPETWETGWFWWGNLATFARRGWFERGTFYERWGFDVYDVSTTNGADVWRDWGVVVPDWVVMAGLAIVPAWWGMGWRGRRRRRRAARGLCGGCGYDLRAHRAGETCPECGGVIGAGGRNHEGTKDTKTHEEDGISQG